MTKMTAHIEYPFVLRENVIAYLKLPQNLTREEVNLIASFLELLAACETKNSKERDENK